MHVFFLLVSAALLVVCSNNFSGQFIGHGFTAPLTCKKNQVLHTVSNFTLSADFGRYLEGSTTYTAALHLYVGSNVFQGFFADFEYRLAFFLGLEIGSAPCRARFLTSLRGLRLRYGLD